MYAKRSRYLPALLLAACARHQNWHAPIPVPPLRCYSVWPDSGLAVLIPRSVVLGSNSTGFLDWLAASVKPDPSFRSEWETSFPHAAARWHQFYQGDSIEVTWSGGGFGPTGTMVVALTADSLHGRAIVVTDLAFLAPWPLVSGKRRSCEPGA
jgi:hypothetical protein